MKLTRRQALEKTRDMWRWLARNPGKSKADYLDCIKAKKEPENNCYLCEYAYNRFSGLPDCNRCPLCDFWPKGVERGANCMHFQSPFMRWRNESLPKDRTAAAHAIADACTKELRKCR